MLGRAATLLLLLLLTASQIANVAHAKSSERCLLSCSVIMYTSYDYTSDKCIKAVINARKNCGGNRINFIPTLFWWDPDNSPTTPPKLNKFCTESGASCQEVNPNSLRAFRSGMHRCFKKAIDMGFTEIDVAPHLDDAKYLHWRAQLVFSPDLKYGSYSYAEAVLQPVADALYAVLKPNLKINFAVVGEMSGTIFRRAKDWLPVLKRVKAMVGKKKKAQLANRIVKVGFSVNWDKLCGCYALSQVDPVKYLNQFKKVYKSLEVKRKWWVKTDVQALFDNLDFVGVSYYPHNVTALTPKAFETSAQLFADELTLFGVDLKAVLKRGVQFRFHEYGVGGGISGHTKPATRLGDLLRYPFFGVGGTYVKKNDPFQLWKPQNVESKQRLLLRKFYRESLKWLSKGGGPTFKVSAVYLWNSGSWDATGVSPDSYSPEGSWRDPYVSDMIKAYNDKGIVPK